MKEESYCVEHAELEWDAHNIPRSKTFHDIYFSPEDGAAESEHVFLAQNNLLERWKEARTFAIGEIGFGTGLNFFLTWQLWRRNRAANSLLHYLSCEQYPLKAEDISRALSRWPALAPLVDAFLKQYTPLVPGFHRLSFPDHGLFLTLLIGDAACTLKEAHATVDAWYLDGFAPEKNPQSWNDQILTEIARLTPAGGSLSTFTASGSVRRKLIELGFEVEKFRGFGSKRESLRGKKTSGSTASHFAPWFQLPPPPQVERKTAAIIGGGLAGTAIASALVDRGWKVDLFERAASLANGASGNRGGIVVPYVAARPNRMTQLYLTSFLYAIHHLDRIGLQMPSIRWKQGGVLHLPATERLSRLHAAAIEAGLHERILTSLSPAAAAERAGIPFPETALFYPLAGAVNPAELCRAHTLMCGDRLTVHLNAEICSLNRINTEWQLCGPGHTQVGSAEVVVIANAFDARALAQTAWMPLEPVRGEVVEIQTKSALKDIPLPISYDGYVIPLDQEALLLGATYEHHSTYAEPRQSDQQDMAQRLTRWFPEAQDLTCGRGRVAFRTSTHHRLPYIGPVPDFQAYQSLYAGIRRGFSPTHYPRAEYHPHLYVSAGHGSRGLLSTPLGAELLCSLICGEPLPFEATLIQALHPASSIIRHLERN